MSLSRVVSALATHLGADLASPPALIGGGLPGDTGELPAVTISVSDVANQLTAIGARPAPTRRGALAVSQSFDLADPSVSFPDGEVVDLLSPDRTSLHFPYGPVVGVDGTEGLTLAPDDLTVIVAGTPLTVVADNPGAGEVSAQPLTGELNFGTALPATGTLVVSFFVGEWEVETARYQGDLVVEVSAAALTATNQLSVDVEASLGRAAAGSVPGLRSLRPLGLGPIAPVEVPIDSRRRALQYRFDFELEEPVLGSGGGLVGLVAVDSSFGGETFNIPVAAPTP